MRTKIDIGIDPDSKAHGVAIAINGKLLDLYCMDLWTLYQWMQDAECRYDNPVFVLHIENVAGTNATFKKSYVKNAKANTTVSRSIGMCQQSQNELERFLSSIPDIDLTIKHYPLSDHWKPTKGGAMMLKQVFGFTGRSNEEKRSAAYFLCLGLR